MSTTPSVPSRPRRGPGRFAAAPQLPLVPPGRLPRLPSEEAEAENTASVAAALQADVPAGTPSIPEQARALRNDVDNIFQFVHDNIDFIPHFGLHKGGLGGLIDGSANAMDMADLMVQLLRQAGHTANFVFGVIKLSAAQWSNWLGVSDQNIDEAAQLLANGGIPTLKNLQTNEILLDHCWVQVNINGTGPNYVFDPAFKSYDYTSGIDVQAAMQYVRADFLTRANTGTTQTADYVQNINDANINADLKAFSKNLADWIKNNTPGASVDQILGGRSIVPVVGPVRQTDLPYHDTSYGTLVTNVIPSGTDWRATLRFQYDEMSPGVYKIDVTRDTAEIYTKRLTLWFNGSRVATLRLDGTQLGDSSRVMPAGAIVNAIITMTHPYALPPTVDLSHEVPILTSAQTTIGANFGITSKEMAAVHQKAQNQAIADGAAAGDENLLGQTLLLIWDNFMGQGSRGTDFIGRLSSCNTIFHHFIGTVSQRTHGSGKIKLVDSFLGLFSVSKLAPTVDSTSAAFTTSLLFQVLESAAHKQVSGIVTADPIKALREVNLAGTKIYDAKSSNWTSGVNVKNIMTAAGYNSSVLTDVETQFINANPSWRVAMPEDSTIQIGTFMDFYAYVGLGPDGASLSGKTWFNAKGAVSGDYQDDAASNSAASDNARQVNGFGMPAVTAAESARVNMLNGRYEYSSTDLSVGNQGMLYELAFTRSYNSALRLSLSGITSSDQGLGFGWTHNWQMSASVNSDGFVPFGDQQVRAAVGAIAALFVTRDVALSDAAMPINNFVITCIVQQFLNSQLIDNVVRLRFGGSFLVFTKMPYEISGNAVYLPPLGLNGASQLVKDTGTGKFIYTTAEKVVHTYKTTGEMEKIEAPFGITINFTYTSGRLSKVSNGFRDLNFAYDQYDQLATVNDGNGRTMSLTIPASGLLKGHLTSVEDPLGNATTYDYEPRGRLTKVFKPANPTSPLFINSYDTLFRVKEQRDAYNNLWQFFFAGSRSEEVAPNNTSRILYFNAKGSVIRNTNALLQESTTQYDGNQRETLVTLPEGNGVSTTYDANGNVLTVTEHAKPGSGLGDRTTSYTYETNWNKVATVIDDEGNTTSYDYWTAGNNGASLVKKVTGPTVAAGAPSTEFEYNSKGQLTKTTEPTGIVTTNTYEATKNNLVSTTLDPGSPPLHVNISTGFTYDAVGNMLTATDPKGNVTTAVFDGNRRITQVTGPAPFNETAYVEYDDNGNVVQTQSLASSDPNSQVTKRTYAIDGKVLTIVGPANYGEGAQPVPVRYEYDILRRLFKVVDPLGDVATTAFDALSRPVSNAVNGVDQQVFAYTTNGKLLSVTDARNKTTQYEYDGLDRPVRTTYPDTTSEEIVSYDSRDNILEMVTRAGDSFTFTFDALSQLLTKTPSGQATVTFTYDRAGRILTMGVPLIAGDPSTGTFSAFYDTAGRMMKEQYPDGKSVITDLDKNGNVIALKYPDLTQVTHTFDQLNRVTSVVGFNGSVTLAYDSASRRISQLNGNKTGQGYAFDKVDNLLGMTVGGLKPNGSLPMGPRVDFAYGYSDVEQGVSRRCSDSAFVWAPTLMKTIVYGTANNINQYPSVESVPFTYDDNGCLTNDGVNTYTYDSESKLLSFTGPSSTINYKYDPLGRLVEKTVGSTKRRYLYSGLRRIEEYDDAGTLLRRSVYGKGLDECLFVVDVVSGNITYLHADEMGSTVLTTDASGMPTGRNVYTPWGELSSGSLADIGIGFTGQFYDQDADLYFYKARHYSAKLGRFLQTDPIGYSGGLNLYEYCGSDPVNHSDPLGLQPIGNPPIIYVPPPERGSGGGLFFPFGGPNFNPYYGGLSIIPIGGGLGIIAGTNLIVPLPSGPAAAPALQSVRVPTAAELRAKRLRDSVEEYQDQSVSPADALFAPGPVKTIIDPLAVMSAMVPMTAAGGVIGRGVRSIGQRLLTSLIARSGRSQVGAIGRRVKFTDWQHRMASILENKLKDSPDYNQPEWGRFYDRILNARTPSQRREVEKWINSIPHQLESRGGTHF